MFAEWELKQNTEVLFGSYHIHTYIQKKFIIIIHSLHYVLWELEVEFQVHLLV